jgi:hypothetical protein
LVGNYVYLREITRQKYQDLALMQVLHERLDTIGAQQAGPEVNPTSKSPAKLPHCSHCSSRDLHTLFGAEHGKNQCPLKDTPKTDAAAFLACRKEIVTKGKKLSDPTDAQLKAILDAAVAGMKKP